MSVSILGPVSRPYQIYCLRVRESPARSSRPLFVARVSAVSVGTICPGSAASATDCQLSLRRCPVTTQAQAQGCWHHVHFTCSQRPPSNAQAAYSHHVVRQRCVSVGDARAGGRVALLVCELKFFFAPTSPKRRAAAGD